MAKEKIRRPQTVGEEIANTVSHGLGALLAAAGAVPLLVKAAMDSGQAVAGMALYAASLLALYAASSVYHGVRSPALKKRLRVLDHCSIFLLILGTYIPMALMVLGGGLGWTLIGINTALAAVGIVLDLIDLERFSRVTLVLYAAMGWLILPAIGRVVTVMPPAGVALLAGGGAAYTAGILSYKSKGRYMHFVWHLFVLAGSVLQYFCVLLYCL